MPLSLAAGFSGSVSKLGLGKESLPRVFSRAVYCLKGPWTGSWDASRMKEAG